MLSSLECAPKQIQQWKLDSIQFYVGSARFATLNDKLCSFILPVRCVRLIKNSYFCSDCATRRFIMSFHFQYLPPTSKENIICIKNSTQTKSTSNRETIGKRKVDFLSFFPVKKFEILEQWQPLLSIFMSSSTVWYKFVSRNHLPVK